MSKSTQLVLSLVWAILGTIFGVWLLAAPPHSLAAQLHGAAWLCFALMHLCSLTPAHTFKPAVVLTCALWVLLSVAALALKVLT